MAPREKGKIHKKLAAVNRRELTCHRINQTKQRTPSSLSMDAFKVFVGGFRQRDANEAYLGNKFQIFGEITSIEIIASESNPRAIITFGSEESARKACSALDGKYDTDANKRLWVLMRGIEDVSQGKGVVDAPASSSMPKTPVEHLVTDMVQRVVEHHFDDINRKVGGAKQEAIDAKQEAIDAKQEAIDAKQEAIDAKQKAIDAKQEAIDAKQKAIDAKQKADTTGNRVDKLEDDHADTVNRVDKLEDHHADTVNRVAMLEDADTVNRLDDVERRQGEGGA
ncbi:hypothetical protein KSP39_PZI000420 [Platanthera zijinensis]|uniref:RRM domain-containing protein n=1 Tax=Platanthera zijinensis TaxID=2320716 RepID=A0AAP0GFB9_9ASPA